MGTCLRSGPGDSSSPGITTHERVMKTVRSVGVPTLFNILQTCMYDWWNRTSCKRQLKRNVLGIYPISDLQTEQTLCAFIILFVKCLRNGLQVFKFYPFPVRRKSTHTRGHSALSLSNTPQHSSSALSFLSSATLCLSRCLSVSLCPSSHSVCVC